MLEEVKALKKAGKLEVDLLEVDFDPLYGLSGWLDRALTTAQRDLLISFPNPSYDQIEIRYRPEEATRVLNRIGNADVFADTSGVAHRQTRPRFRRTNCQILARKLPGSLAKCPD